MNVRDAVTVCLKKLKKSNKKIENPLNEIYVILSYLSNKDKNFLFINKDYELSDSISESLFSMYDERISSKPLAYIVKNKEFYGMDFYVDEYVLIPRPETEGLIELYSSCHEMEDKILDLCTGSGAIAVSIKNKFEDVDMYASDISEKAIDVACKNAQRYELDINFIVSDLYAHVEEKFDVIISNPPYIGKMEYENLQDEIYYEPKTAFLGGEEGYEIYEEIIKGALEHLRVNGKLILEIHYNQQDKIRDLLKKYNFKNISIKKDYAGYYRYVYAEIKG